MKWMGELYTDLKRENPESKFNYNHLSDNGKNEEKTLRINIIYNSTPVVGTYNQQNIK